MSKKYVSKKDVGFALLFIACPLLTWLILFLHPNSYFFFFALVTTLFFSWIWFGTYYLLDNEYFMCRCGPLKKKIPIDKIVEIRRNVMSFHGMRPALTFNYLQIRYNRYDDVYIAPEDEEAFIQELMGRNPYIAIIEHAKLS